MKTLHTIYHKKDETFDVNFFENAEYTKAFDFNGKEHLYIELINGDISPITAMADKLLENASVYTLYIPNCHKPYPNSIITLDDITPNLLKYIPEDNAVLFLSEEDIPYSDTQFSINFQMHYPNFEIFKNSNDKPKKLTIFLRHGNQSELQKAEKVAKYLWENFQIKPDLFVLHCFVNKDFILNIYENSLTDSCLNEAFCNFNKIITTNSTGILKPEDSSECLQIIDCKEIFEEHLNK